MKTKATSREVAWRATGDSEVPYQAVIDGRRWSLRLNDFPREPLYTLLVDGAPVMDIDDWPPAWRRP